MIIHDPNGKMSYQYKYEDSNEFGHGEIVIYDNFTDLNEFWCWLDGSWLDGNSNLLETMIKNNEVDRIDDVKLLIADYRRFIEEIEHDIGSITTLKWRLTKKPIH